MTNRLHGRAGQCFQCPTHLRSGDRSAHLHSRQQVALQPYQVCPKGQSTLNMPCRHQYCLRVRVRANVQVRDRDAAEHHASPLDYGVEIIPARALGSELDPHLLRSRRDAGPIQGTP